MRGPDEHYKPGPDFVPLHPNHEKLERTLAEANRRLDNLAQLDKRIEAAKAIMQSTEKYLAAREPQREAGSMDWLRWHGIVKAIRGWLAALQKESTP